MESHIINKSKNLQLYSVTMLVLIAGICIFSLWIYTNGYPFIHHNDESFLSYIHAWYLNFTNPFDFYFLTKEEPLKVYTHNPNLPRYFHYLLMKTGITKFTYQLLIISLAATASTIFLLHSSLLKATRNYYIVILSVIFLMTTPQFVLHSHNTYRIFSFLLFALMMYSVSNNKKLLLLSTVFLLFQYEYAFAFFIASTFFIYLILDGANKNKKTLIFFCTGALISILIFAIQVTLYLSPTEVYREIFEVVMPTRGAANRPISGILLTFKGVISKDSILIWNTYVTTLMIALAYIISSHKFFRKYSFLAKIHRQELEFSSKLLVSIFIGGFATAVALPGYCADAFGDYNFPFTSFHKTAIFIFILCLGYCIVPMFFKKDNKHKLQHLLIILLSIPFILNNITISSKYFDLSKINRGEYLQVFDKYEHKHYISNFWNGRVKNNIVRPLYPELAYGIEAISKAIVRYKENYTINYQDSFYYICVKQQPYNCQEMQSALNDKWSTKVIEDVHDYLIVEFSPESLATINNKALGITEEYWVELALKFIDIGSFKTAIQTTNIELNFHSHVYNIYDSHTHGLNMLHAIRKSFTLIQNSSNAKNIDKEQILYLQMRHPITWKAALLIANSRYLAEKEHRSFPNKEDITKSYDILEDALT